MSKGKIVARFGLLTAMMFVLSLIDRAIPLSSILGGGVPGMKLGLANTVLLFAVYMINWKGAVLLALVKVLLSGFLYGSLAAILYSLSGSTLSLAVMLAVKRKPDLGAAVIGLATLIVCDILLIQNPSPRGERLFITILVAVAGFVSLLLAVLIHKGVIRGVSGTSIAGAVAHNVGQVLTAALILQTPRLLLYYLPVLAGVGVGMGCLTGIVADRTFIALRMIPILKQPEKEKV